MPGEKHTTTFQVSDGFWSRYRDLVRDVIIPYQYNALSDTIEGAAPSHAIENFKIAAGLSRGDFYGFVFQDSDVAKAIRSGPYTCIAVWPISPGKQGMKNWQPHAKGCGAI